MLTEYEIAELIRLVKNEFESNEVCRANGGDDGAFTEILKKLNRMATETCSPKTKSES